MAKIPKRGETREKIPKSGKFLSKFIPKDVIFNEKVGRKCTVRKLGLGKKCTFFKNIWAWVIVTRAFQTQKNIVQTLKA